MHAMIVPDRGALPFPPSTLILFGVFAGCLIWTNALHKAVVRRLEESTPVRYSRFTKRRRLIADYRKAFGNDRTIRLFAVVPWITVGVLLFWVAWNFYLMFGQAR
jgi:hypothetical protein